MKRNVIGSGPCLRCVDLGVHRVLFVVLSRIELNLWRKCCLSPFPVTEGPSTDTKILHFQQGEIA